MLIEKKISDVFGSLEAIEDTFTFRINNNTVYSDLAKECIIKENINIQMDIAQGIYSEDSIFRVRPLKDISEDEQIYMSKILFDDIMLIKDKSNSVIEIIGKSKIIKKIFWNLYNSNNINSDISKYLLETNEYKLSKNVKYNTPYEFIPDYSNNINILENPMFSIMFRYKNNPLSVNGKGFFTKLNIDYLQTDSNIIALKKLVRNLYFIEYNIHKNTFVFWNQ
ncbi:MAG: hypothetical protein ACTTHM_06820 [Peptoanaerobacter stomatis]|uniref:hypothetical protein n=1 Tax=Peptoanaerobacter stomatis TaxID=796937 RepID=UPI003F9FFF86